MTDVLIDTNKALACSQEILEIEGELRTLCSVIEGVSDSISLGGCN